MPILLIIIIRLILDTVLAPNNVLIILKEILNHNIRKTVLSKASVLYFFFFFSFFPRLSFNYLMSATHVLNLHLTRYPITHTPTQSLYRSQSDPTTSFSILYNYWNSLWFLSSITGPNHVGLFSLVLFTIDVTPELQFIIFWM